MTATHHNAEWGLRSATSDDLAEIMTIENQVFPSDAWSSATMLSELSGPHGYYRVAVADDLLGYAGLLAPPSSAAADIQTIAVVPAARGRGIGRALLVDLLAEAWRRGASEVFLEARADNPVALRLYCSAGFEQIALRKRYYQPDAVDAVVMRLRRDATRVGAS